LNFRHQCPEGGGGGFGPVADLVAVPRLNVRAG
jgi:hypothetical protein